MKEQSHIGQNDFVKLMLAKINANGENLERQRNDIDFIKKMDALYNDTHNLDIVQEAIQARFKENNVKLEVWLTELKQMPQFEKRL